MYKYVAFLFEGICAPISSTSFYSRNC